MFLFFRLLVYIYVAWVDYSRLRGEVVIQEIVLTLLRCAAKGQAVSFPGAYLEYDGKGTATLSRPGKPVATIGVALVDTLDPDVYPRPETTRAFACDQFEDSRAARQRGHHTTMQFTSGKVLSAWVTREGVNIFEYDGTFAVCTPVK